MPTNISSNSNAALASPAPLLTIITPHSSSLLFQAAHPHPILTTRTSLPRCSAPHPLMASHITAFTHIVVPTTPVLPIPRNNRTGVVLQPRVLFSHHMHAQTLPLPPPPLIPRPLRAAVPHRPRANAPTAPRDRLPPPNKAVSVPGIHLP